MRRHYIIIMYTYVVHCHAKPFIDHACMPIDAAAVPLVVAKRHWRKAGRVKLHHPVGAAFEKCCERAEILFHCCFAHGSGTHVVKFGEDDEDPIFALQRRLEPGL